MRHALLTLACAMVLVMAAAVPGMAQDSGAVADLEMFEEACNTLEGALPAACTCAAEHLATQIPADAYNTLAEAWLKGEMLTPGEAESVLGFEVVDAVETAFDNCGP